MRRRRERTQREHPLNGSYAFSGSLKTACHGIVSSEKTCCHTVPTVETLEGWAVLRGASSFHMTVMHPQKPRRLFSKSEKELSGYSIDEASEFRRSSAISCENNETERKTLARTLSSEVGKLSECGLRRARHRDALGTAVREGDRRECAIDQKRCTS